MPVASKASTLDRITSLEAARGVAGALDVFRSGEWLSPKLARITVWTLLAAGACVVGNWLGVWSGRLELDGKRLGLDFMSFWSASKLTLSGHAAAAYGPSIHQAQTAIFHRDTGYLPFFYPPIFLLICAPLALLPYVWSYVLWVGVTGAAYWRTVKTYLGGSASSLVILAFPGVLLNAGYGQNGFLTAALLGAGAGWLKRRPILAGICLGALCYKPQFALVIPIMLVLWRRWRVFAAATVTVLGLAALSLAMFGPGAWSAFLANGGLARAVLEQGLVSYAKMQSLFAAVRLWGGPAWLAYAAQAALVAGVIAGLVWLRRRDPQGRAESAAMITAALLATPYLLDYDLAILALPLAWMFREGRRSGFDAWEKTVLAAAYVLPLVSHTLAASAGLALAPLVLSALFLLTLRRGGQARGESLPASAAGQAA